MILKMKNNRKGGGGEPQRQFGRFLLHFNSTVIEMEEGAREKIGMISFAFL